MLKACSRIGTWGYLLVYGYCFVWPSSKVPMDRDSYTLAMLIASVSALVFAFIGRNTLLRTIAMVGVGLTIAKVFVIDMTDLGGLIRVLSFMGLGVPLMH